MNNIPSESLHACMLRGEVDLSGVQIIRLQPEPAPVDYRAAMTLANAEAARHFDDYMLVAWYDRDRDFESPQHSSECHADSAVPGYVDYALSHGASLMIDIQDGRFVFI